MSTQENDVKQPEIQAMIKPGDDALEMGFSSGAAFALLQRVATVLSQSSLVPTIYQANLPNCIIALNMAARMRADPLMVMQNLYIVYNRPGWSAKFLIATINQSGGFSKLRYEWKGEPNTPEWGCRAWALEKATSERLEGPWITWKMANEEGWVNKNGSKWKTIPTKMFMYRAGAWFVDLYAPELSMGLPTREELEDLDTLEMAEHEPGVYSTAPLEPEPPEPGKANADKTHDLTQKLKAERETRTVASSPEKEAAVDKTEPETTAPAPEAAPKEEPRMREPGEEEDADGDKVAGQRKELESLFVKVAAKHSEKFAKERLEMATNGTRSHPRVKEEKLGAAIDGMLAALEMPVQK